MSWDAHNLRAEVLAEFSAWDHFGEDAAVDGHLFLLIRGREWDRARDPERNQRPDRKAWRKAYDQARRQNPEFLAKSKAWKADHYARQQAAKGKEGRREPSERWPALCRWCGEVFGAKRWTGFEWCSRWCKALWAAHVEGDVAMGVAA